MDVDRGLAEEASALRGRIAGGESVSVALAARLDSLPLQDRDAFVDAVLGLEDAPPDGEDLPRQGVPYLPCGVDEILTVVKEAPLTARDTFVDVGSGLGRVAMLAHLLTGARATGVEIQAGLVDAARARAAVLHLSEVSFLHADASAVSVDGSVFFLYAPANGAMLRRIVDRLEALARARPVVVACVGLEIHDAPALVRRTTSHVAVTLYDAR